MVVLFYLFRSIVGLFIVFPLECKMVLLFIDNDFDIWRKSFYIEQGYWLEFLGGDVLDIS